MPFKPMARGWGGQDGPEQLPIHFNFNRLVYQDKTSLTRRRFRGVVAETVSATTPWGQEDFSLFK